MSQSPLSPSPLSPSPEPAGAQPPRRPAWRAFLRRHLVLVIVIGVLLALTITLYLVESNTSVRVFYRFAD